MNGFESAGLKLNRAQKHISDVEAAVLSIPGRYRSSIQVNSKCGGQSIRYEIANLGEINNEIALATGDAVHNLKTSLDHAWIAAIGDRSRSAKFPIRKDAA